jgi:predicted deacetylase
MAPTHVSIHDVSPAFDVEIGEALAMCEAVGARAALLVVPDFHGKWPLDRYPAFAARLRDLQAAGHEIHLHGYYHLAGVGEDHGEGKPGKLARMFAQRVVSAGEAEFSDVSRAEAIARLDAGERMLEGVGLRIDGFVAPAWSMPPWLLPMLGARGIRYCEDRARVYDPVRWPSAAASRVSLVLNFASRTPARLWSSVGFVRVAGPARRVLPTRIAIHPGDMRSGVLRAEVARVLGRSRGRFVRDGRALLGGSSDTA